MTLIGKGIDGQTAHDSGHLLQGKDGNGNAQHILVNPLGQLEITSADSPAIDAFSRWRVSSPITLFDSKNIFNDDGLADSVENQPLFFDNQETSGGGTSTAYNANESS